MKVKLTEKTGEIEFRMIEGSDEFIQLESLLASFILAGEGKYIDPNSTIHTISERKNFGGI